MKGLQIFSRMTKYEHPPPTPRTDIRPNTICAQLKRVFRGPPKPPRRQPEYRDEKKYKHVPTHSASSFTKTTTTAAMIAAVTDSQQPEAAELDPKAQGGPTDEQLIQIDQSLEDSSTTKSHAAPAALEQEPQSHPGPTEEPLIQLNEHHDNRDIMDRALPAESLI